MVISSLRLALVYLAWGFKVIVDDCSIHDLFLKFESVTSLIQLIHRNDILKSAQL